MRMLQSCAVTAALIGLGLMAAPMGASQDAPTIDEPKNVFKELPVSIRVRQRSTTSVSESGGALSLTVGDITRGQVIVTLLGKGNAALLGPLSMKPGESARFRVGQTDYALKLTRLDNALVGDDFATFVFNVAKRAELTDAEKIQRLIQVVEKADAVFIRSGTEYSAAEAAKHLRTKLNAASRASVSAPMPAPASDPMLHHAWKPTMSERP
jgi:hypothetical protein